MERVACPGEAERRRIPNALLDSAEPATPALPDEAEEAAYLAGANDQEAAAPAATPVVELEAQASLPPLEELVRRIPADVRAALDELFRARFTGVKRATESELGSQPAK